MNTTEVDSLPPNEELRWMLSTRNVRLADGTIKSLSLGTSPAECRCMYQLLLDRKPQHVIEIGMAYGVSALTILTALRENGQGKLTSIDPYPKFDSARKSASWRLSKPVAIALKGLSLLKKELDSVSEGLS